MKLKNLYKKAFLLVCTLYSIKTKAYENNELAIKKTPYEIQNKNYFVPTSAYVTKENSLKENAIVLKSQLKHSQISKINTFKSYAPEKEISLTEAHMIFAKELVKLGFSTVTQACTHTIQFLNLTRDYVVYFLETPVEKQEEKELYIRELISQEKLKEEEKNKLRKANLSAAWDTLKKVIITSYSDIVRPWILISITNKDLPSIGSIGSFLKVNVTKNETVNQSSMQDKLFDLFKKCIFK